MSKILVSIGTGDRKEHIPLNDANFKKVFAHLLMETNFPYSSMEQRKQNLKDALDMFRDMLKALGNRPAAVGRITQLMNSVDRLKNDREKMDIFFYNLVLGFEGKGLLHNFSMTNAFGSVVKGNPEKQSIGAIGNNTPWMY